MTDLELIEILERQISNLEKALAIRTALKASTPSAFNVKPDKQRKKPEKRKPVSPVSDLLDAHRIPEGHTQ